MEDVLDVYAAPYDPAHPVVCFDESPKQLIGEVRDPEPPKPGTPARQDTEYQRNGVRNLMMKRLAITCKASVKWVDGQGFRQYKDGSWVAIPAHTVEFVAKWISQ